jgi:hypothetical protein
LGEQVELRVTVQGLVIAPLRPARQGWKQAFIADRTEGKDLLLKELPASRFDREEWGW